MDTIKTFLGQNRVTNPDTISGATVAVTPGLIYAICHFLGGVTIEKWVSVATLILVVLQIVFTLRRELKKRRSHKPPPPYGIEP